MAKMQPPSTGAYSSIGRATARHRGLHRQKVGRRPVTGASSGIGRATTRHLAAKGYKVVLVSRNADKLERIADQIAIDGGEALVLTANLEVEGECAHLYDEITTDVGQVDVLVNGPGSGWYRFSDEMPWVEALRMIDINIKAMANITLLFLPGMKERGQGHIINISSIAGGLPSQGSGLYSATKSFSDDFTTSLHRELKGTGVHISSVRPGPVRTSFLDPVAAELKRFGIPFKRLAIRPEMVAVGITRLIKRPKRVVYLPRILRMVPWLKLSLDWLMDMLGPLLLKRREGTTIRA